MLHQLAHLARSDSGTSRWSLLDQITDLFLHGVEHHTDQVTVLYADIVLNLLESIEEPSRVEYSQKIADSEYIPRPVVRQLAHDEIAVAVHVLARSPVLNDEDLLSVVENQSQRHLLAVSQRESIAEPVTDALVEKGDLTVVRTVSANAGARFSADGIVQLALRTVDDSIVRGNVLRRGDIRDQVMDRIEPLVSEDTAERLRAIMDDADDESIVQIAQTAEVKLAKRAHNESQRSQVLELVDEIGKGDCSVDEAVEQLCSANQFSSVILLVSELSGVPEAIVSNAMFKTINEPAAILLRAIGADEAAFEAVQTIRARRLRLRDSHIEAGMETFQRITPESARDSVRRLQARQANS